MTKLTPLANIDVDTFTKLVGNIEKLAKLSIVQVADPKASDQKSCNDKSQELDLNTLFFSCHSVSDITSKCQ